MSISEKINQLQQEIVHIAQRVGRDPHGVKLLLVTKYVEADRIMQAYQSGCRLFGENKVQEYLEKRDRLPKDVAWHMIGRLQTNKVKSIIGNVALIHSLDRPDLADEIEKQAKKQNVEKVACLVQVNSTGEETKAGFDLMAAERFIRHQPKDSRIEIKGLMTMGPLEGSESEIRGSFSATKELFDLFSKSSVIPAFSILSMGMSSDYQIAIEEGSTMIRVGSKVFGPRS